MLGAVLKFLNRVRKLDTKHWKNTKDLEGLLFFAELLDEMLFDYSLDSYKPLALNSRTLCIECLTTIEEVRNGFMKEKNLQSVIEELKWSLSCDLAAKEILGAKFDLYLNKLTPTSIHLDALEIIVTFIYNSFNEKKYLTQIKRLLVENVKDGKKKEKISSLTNSYISELVNYGYNSNHIYYQNSNFFFNPSKKGTIDNPDDVKDFLEIFNFEEKEFTVVFIGGIIFRDFKDTLNEFNIVVTKRYNCFSRMADDVAFRQSRKSDESFIICSKVKTFDHHTAREIAETLIGEITGLFNFYHHKQKPEILDKVVISRTSDNYVVILDKPTKSILKIKNDKGPKEAAEAVKETRSKLAMTGESTYRIARCIDLHSTALSSTAIENQLLNLWAAIETLMPKSWESKKDRIVQICDSLIPFLQLHYINKQLIELLSDLKLWNEKAIDTVLAKVPDSATYTELEKIACLISLNSHKPLREELYVQLDDFPLLKNRIYTLHESINSPEKVKKLLDNHHRKVNWHLRRIYRTRGLIIHSGKYPSYTMTLVENLHNYLDIFVKKILTLAQEREFRTIEQAILETQLSVEYQFSLLSKHQKEELTALNFKETILGEKF